jgi:hypothetical protein
MFGGKRKEPMSRSLWQLLNNLAEGKARQAPTKEALEHVC